MDDVATVSTKNKVGFYRHRPTSKMVTDRKVAEIRSIAETSLLIAQKWCRHYGVEKCLAFKKGSSHSPGRKAANHPLPRVEPVEFKVKHGLVNVDEAMEHWRHKSVFVQSCFNCYQRERAFFRNNPQLHAAAKLAVMDPVGVETEGQSQWSSDIDMIGRLHRIHDRAKRDTSRRQKATAHSLDKAHSKKPRYTLD